eukprot:TRINITY_DN2253_c0_g1_i1.p1 TRINITY_DN2253_c0_g1~~TRINITY_DN2253_c0_g1_i1.p1  ORF type:complete len:303 (-),score=35.64 TRINITY_DN2253_c0_g1_i1:127-1035(-)
MKRRDSDKERRPPRGSTNTSGSGARSPRRDSRKPAGAQVTGQAAASNTNGTTSAPNTTQPGTVQEGRRRRTRSGRGRSDSSPNNASILAKPSIGSATQLQLGPANFPPLNSPVKGSANGNGYAKDFKKFGRNELLSIVNDMDMTKQTGPPFVIPANCPVVMSTAQCRPILVPRPHDTPSVKTNAEISNACESAPSQSGVSEAQWSEKQAKVVSSTTESCSQPQQAPTTDDLSAINSQVTPGSSQCKEQEAPSTPIANRHVAEELRGAASPTYAQIVRPASRQTPPPEYPLTTPPPATPLHQE